MIQHHLRQQEPGTDVIAADVVRVVLPRFLHGPSEFALVLLLSAAAALVVYSSAASGPGPGRHWGIALAAALIGVPLLLVAALALHRARILRRAENTIDRAAAGEPVPDADLCVAAAVLGGATRLSIRRLRRQHLDAIEHATGRVLPRVWLMDRTATRALTARPADVGEKESWFKVATTPAPPSEHAVRIVLVVAALLGTCAVHLMVVAGWLAPRGMVINGLVGVFMGALLAAPALAFFRSSGYWLRTSLDSAQLLLLDRRGRPRRNPIPIDPVDTIVLIRKRGEENKVDGKVLWRLLPPHPAAPIDAADLQDGLTPWSALSASLASGQHPVR